MEHFRSPRNVGEVDDPDLTSRAENPVCGDDVRATFRVRDGRIVAMRYRAFGCHATVAVMSALSERVRGKLLATERARTPEEIIAWFDRFPSGKRHAAELAVEILRGASGT